MKRGATIVKHKKFCSTSAKCRKFGNSREAAISTFEAPPAFSNAKASERLCLRVASFLSRFAFFDRSPRSAITQMSRFVARAALSRAACAPLLQAHVRDIHKTLVIAIAAAAQTIAGCFVICARARDRRRRATRQSDVSAVCATKYLTCAFAWAAAATAAARSRV